MNSHQGQQKKESRKPKTPSGKAIFYGSKGGISTGPHNGLANGAHYSKDGLRQHEMFTCFICATENPTHWALYECSHKVCSLCMLRMRKLYEKDKCAWCNIPSERVLVIKSSAERDQNESLKFDNFLAKITEVDFTKSVRRETQNSKDLALSSTSTLIFEDSDVRKCAYDDIITIKCHLFNCPQPLNKQWKTIEAFRQHVHQDHHMSSCDICFENRKWFPHEFVFYSSASELRRHQVSRENGHPPCSVCSKLYYSQDELLDHCRKEHEFCFICRRNQGSPQSTSATTGINERGDPLRTRSNGLQKVGPSSSSTTSVPSSHLLEQFERSRIHALTYDPSSCYFKDYGALEEHFRRNHYICTDPLCLELKFVVFENEFELKSHMIEVHLGDKKMQRAERNRLSRIEEFMGGSLFGVEGENREWRTSSRSAPSTRTFGNRGRRREQREGTVEDQEVTGSTNDAYQHQKRTPHYKSGAIHAKSQVRTNPSLSSAASGPTRPSALAIDSSLSMEQVSTILSVGEPLVFGELAIKSVYDQMKNSSTSIHLYKERNDLLIGKLKEFLASGRGVSSKLPSPRDYSFILDGVLAKCDRYQRGKISAEQLMHNLLEVIGEEEEDFGKGWAEELSKLQLDMNKRMNLLAAIKSVFRLLRLFPALPTESPNMSNMQKGSSGLFESGSGGSSSTLATRLAKRLQKTLSLGGKNPLDSQSKGTVSRKWAATLEPKNDDTMASRMNSGNTAGKTSSILQEKISSNVIIRLKSPASYHTSSLNQPHTSLAPIDPSKNPLSLLPGGRIHRPSIASGHAGQTGNTSVVGSSMSAKKSKKKTIPPSFKQSLFASSSVGINRDEGPATSRMTTLPVEPLMDDGIGSSDVTLEVNRPKSKFPLKSEGFKEEDDVFLIGDEYGAKRFDQLKDHLIDSSVHGETGAPSFTKGSGTALLETGTKDQRAQIDGAIDESLGTSKKKKRNKGTILLKYG